MEMPINIQLSNAKGRINNLISELLMEYGLPAFLLSGVLADVMLDVKKQEILELTKAYNSKLEKLEEKEG